MSFVWLNGLVVPASEARISVLDRGVIWGYGLFETLRSYQGALWAFDEHYERLRAGSEVLDLPVPEAPVVRDAMEAVLDRNRLRDAGVRLTVTKGSGPADPHEDPSEPANSIVTVWPLRDYRDLYERGASLITLPEGGRPLAGIKTTSYAPSVAGRVAARRAGADDALFVGPSGHVLETTGSNLFALFGRRLVTPPVAAGVLPGVTRRTLLDVARELGWEPAEEPLSLTELFGAEEVLLSSTLREVYGVRSIDRRRVPTGPAAARLRHAFHERVRAVLGVG